MTHIGTLVEKINRSSEENRITKEVDDISFQDHQVSY